MLRLAAAVSAAMFAMPVLGQVFVLEPAQYTVMGTLDVTVDGTEHHLVIPLETAGSAFASERIVKGRRWFILAGYTVGDTGNLMFDFRTDADLTDNPRLQMSFWVDDGAGALEVANFFDGGSNTPLSAGSTGGTVAFSAFSITEANEIKASFTGEFLRMENYMSAPAIAPDATPVAFSGTVVVTVPNLE